MSNTDKPETETSADDNTSEDRREFLKKAGKFAAVTPPAVMMMLSISEKAGAQVTPSGPMGTPEATPG